MEEVLLIRWWDNVYLVVPVDNLCTYLGGYIIKFVISNTGDVVEAVVPFMGESITDGTLASFLKRMSF